MKNFILIFILLSFVQMPPDAQNIPKDFKLKVETFVKKAMNATHIVPGLGLAVVKDNQVIFAEGFGYRDVENQLPVTAETGFYIASTTKSLMGMAAAQLEHQGLVELDSPLANFYPGRNFLPPLDATKVKLVNLFSHKHNLSNDFLQYHLTFINEHSQENFERILFDFTRPRENEFQYSNTSINIAANALERASGKSWKELVAQWVFAPIGMKRTTSYMSTAEQKEFAFPYIQLNGQYQRLAIKVDGQMQSAGGTVTTPKDYARWLLVNINKGKIDGKQVIPAEVIERAQRSYANLDANYFKFHRKGYGLGLYHADYEGDKLMHHFGGFAGYMAHTSFMPERKIGVVALSNESNFGGRLPHLVACYIYDLLLGKENLEEKYDKELEEWKASIVKNQERTKGRLKQKEDLVKKAATNPSNWQYDPQAFCGVYNNPRIGHFTVMAKEDNSLSATYGPHTAPMFPSNKNQFLLDWQITGLVSPPTQLTVQYNPKGIINALIYEGVEFRLLPTGTHPDELNIVYKTTNELLSKYTKAFQKEDAGALKDFFQKNYKKGAITESYLNALGYCYLKIEHIDLAIAIFESVLGFYPNSSNAYDSLGEAYLKADNKELAKKYYEKSLQLDPENENAQQVLEKLEKDK